MNVEFLQPDSYRDWDAYVERHPDSTCYHLRGWADVARIAYKLPTPFLIARASRRGDARAHGSAPPQGDTRGAVQGVLPLFVVRGLIKTHLTNGLFGAYGPVLAESPEARLALLTRAVELFRAERLDHLMLKCLGEPLPLEIRDACELQTMDNWVVATLPLDPDPEKLWRGLRDKMRNMVRKSRKHGLELRSGEAQLEAFYDVLCENMHHKGTPIYGLQFMRELFTVLGERADILTLWHRDACVAGAMVIDYHGVTHVPFASSRPWALPMSPNNLLYWEVIRRGCLREMRVLDFGRSNKDSGALAFKQGWGASIQPQPTYIGSCPGKSLTIDPKDRRVHWFARQWSRLPRPVANHFGPQICKQLAGLI